MPTTVRGTLSVTRRCLEVLLDHQTPVSIVTKSTLILRDSACSPRWLGDQERPSIHHYHAGRRLWRLIEPGTPPPLKRLEVIRRLSESGVRCGVFLAPILPGITDSMASIEAVAAAAKAHGAVSFGSAVLRLAPHVKEHYLDFVADTFPALLPRYERAYAGSNISSDYQAAIELRIARIRRDRGSSRMRCRAGGVKREGRCRSLSRRWCERDS